MPVKTSPESAPDYALYRGAIATADVMTNVVKKHGCNAYMYNYAHIQVVPAGGANPNVAVWWWSDKANAFVQEHTPIAKAGVGADTPYEFTIEPKGRIFFVQVAVIAAGNVDVLVSGYERHQF